METTFDASVTLQSDTGLHKLSFKVCLINVKKEFIITQATEKAIAITMAAQNCPESAIKQVTITDPSLNNES